MEKDLNEIKNNIKIAKALEEDIREFQSYDLDKAYLKVEAKIKKSNSRQNFRMHIYRAASILFIPLLISTIAFLYLYVNSSSDEGITYYTVTSAPGIITRVELPDSSKVWLNACSSLRYPSRFTSNKREVHLSGESYFQVKSDRENPFYVTLSHGMQVMARGTSFNINSYDDDTFIKTVLESGVVDILVYNQNPVQLNPGQSAFFDKNSGRMNISSVNIEEKTAWRNGQLIFRNKTIDEVAKVLSRRYNVDIVLHKESTKEYRFRATFTNETITQILDYMKLAAPIEWSFAPAKQLPDSKYEKQKIEIWIK